MLAIPAKYKLFAPYQRTYTIIPPHSSFIPHPSRQDRAAPTRARVAFSEAAREKGTRRPVLQAAREAPQPRGTPPGPSPTRRQRHPEPRNPCSYDACAGAGRAHHGAGRAHHGARRAPADAATEAAAAAQRCSLRRSIAPPRRRGEQGISSVPACGVMRMNGLGMTNDLRTTMRGA